MEFREDASPADPDTVIRQMLQRLRYNRYVGLHELSEVFEALAVQGDGVLTPETSRLLNNLGGNLVTAVLGRMSSLHMRADEERQLQLLLGAVRAITERRLAVGDTSFVSVLATALDMRQRAYQSIDMGYSSIGGGGAYGNMAGGGGGVGMDENIAEELRLRTVRDFSAAGGFRGLVDVMRGPERAGEIEGGGEGEDAGDGADEAVVVGASVLSDALSLMVHVDVDVDEDADANALAVAEEGQALVLEACQIAIEGLLSMPPALFRKQPKDARIQVLRHVAVLLGEHSEVASRFWMDISLKCFRIAAFEERLTGVELLKTLCGNTEDGAAVRGAGGQPNDDADDDDGSGARWLTPALLIDWLRSNSVLTDLLQMQTEVVTRSSELVLFYLEHSGPADIAQFWKSSLGEDEALADAIHHVLVESLGNLSHGPVLLLLQEVAASLQEGCYAPTVDFLGKCYYNRRCVDMLMRSSSDVTEAFVGLLWAAVQNAETRALHYAEVVASTRAQQPKKGGGKKKLSRCAMLIGFFTYGAESCDGHNVRMAYIERCLQVLLTGNEGGAGADDRSTKLICLTIVEKLINTFRNTNYDAAVPDMGQLILILESSHSLLRLLLTLVEASATAESELDEAVRHQGLQLIYFITSRTDKLVLETADVDLLWAAHSSLPKRDKLLLWLRRSGLQVESKGLHSSYMLPCLKHIFIDLLCGNTDALVGIGPDGFSCFEMMFAAVNQDERHLRCSLFADGKVSTYLSVVPPAGDIIGIDSVWALVFRATDSVAQTAATDILLPVYQLLDSAIDDASDAKGLVALRSAFIERVVLQLENAVADRDGGNRASRDIEMRCISLLESYLGNFPKSPSFPPHSHRGNGAEVRLDLRYTRTVVPEAPSKETKTGDGAAAETNSDGDDAEGGDAGNAGDAEETSATAVATTAVAAADQAPLQAAPIGAGANAQTTEEATVEIPTHTKQTLLSLIRAIGRDPGVQAEFPDGRFYIKNALGNRIVGDDLTVEELDLRSGSKVFVSPPYSDDFIGPDDLVGQRIEVHWKKYDKFYPGKVTHYWRGRHTVHYDDKEVKIYALEEKRFNILKDEEGRQSSAPGGSSARHDVYELVATDDRLFQLLFRMMDLRAAAGKPEGGGSSLRVGSGTGRPTTRADRIAKLLASLPTGGSLVDLIADARLVDWASVLSELSFKTVYMLQIVDVFLMPAEVDAQTLAWRDGFIVSGGLATALQLLSQVADGGLGGGAGGAGGAVAANAEAKAGDASSAWPRQTVMIVTLTLRIVRACLAHMHAADNQQSVALVAVLEASFPSQELVNRMLRMMHTIHEGGSAVTTGSAAIGDAVGSVVLLVQQHPDLLPTFLDSDCLESVVDIVRRNRSRETRAQAAELLRSVVGLSGSVAQTLFAVLQAHLGDREMLTGSLATSGNFFELLQFLLTHHRADISENGVAGAWDAFAMCLGDSLSAFGQGGADAEGEAKTSSGAGDKGEQMGEPSGSSGKDDPSLLGYLRVTQTFLSTTETAQRSRFQLALGVSRDEGGSLVTEIFHRYIMTVPTAARRNAWPVCRTEPSKVAALDLLRSLLDGCPENAHELASHLGVVLRESAAMMQLPNSGARGKKAQDGYVGLKNQGCTCYMNALLQQYYMAPQLRQAILSAATPPAALPAVVDAESKGNEGKEPSKAEERDELLREVQRTFCYLEEGLVKHYDPRQLVESCTTLRLEHRVLEQNDAGEFCDKLSDELRELLQETKSPSAALLDAAIRGSLVYQNIRRPCNHRTERTEGFQTLKMDIKPPGKDARSTLTECLESYVEGEQMTGSNQTECDDCTNAEQSADGKPVKPVKRDALRRTCIAELPNMLMLNLGRFALDYETFQTKKVQSRLEFPMRLNMLPYTKEGLEAQLGADGGADGEGKDSKLAAEEGEGNEDGNEEGNEDGEGSSGAAAVAGEGGATVDTDPKFLYNLVGVLVHTGVAGGGHYYSFIKERTGPCWYIFDDKRVDKIGTEEKMEDLRRTIDAQCFGGKVVSTYNSHYGGTRTVEEDKPYNAYMLFYERQTTDPATTVLARSPLPAEFVGDVWTSNERSLRQRSLHDPTFCEFFVRVMTSGTDGTALVLGEVGLTFFFNVLVHSTETLSPEMIAVLINGLKASADMSLFLLASATGSSAMQTAWLKTPLLDTDDTTMRQAAADLYACAIEKVVSECSEEQQGKVIVKFLLLITMMVPDAAYNPQYMTPYLGLLRKLTAMDALAAQMKKCKLFSWLVHLFMNADSHITNLPRLMLVKLGLRDKNLLVDCLANLLPPLGEPDGEEPDLTELRLVADKRVYKRLAHECPRAAAPLLQTLSCASNEIGHEIFEMLINQAVGATGSTSADCLVLMIPENPRRREKVALDILELLLDLAAERKKQAQQSMERAEQTMDRLTVEAMYKARIVAPGHIYELIGILLKLNDQVPEIKAWLQERDNAVHWSEWMVPWLNEAAYTNSLGGNATLGVAAPHVLARNEQLCGLILSSGWKQEDLDALPRPPGRMLSFRVSGAGTDVVNGLYTFDGLFGKGFQFVDEGSPKFSKTEGGVTLTLFRCKLRSNNKIWNLSTITNPLKPGTNSDIDYYNINCLRDTIALPPLSGWGVFGKGIEPLPMLEMVEV